MCEWEWLRNSVGMCVILQFTQYIYGLESPSLHDLLFEMYTKEDTLLDDVHSMINLIYS